MDDAKRKRLDAAGFTVGNAVDVLGLAPARKALVEFRISASLAVRRLRAERGLTQAKEKPPIFGMSRQRGGEVMIRMLENVKQVPIKPLNE